MKFHLPRLAVGTVQPGCQSESLIWGLYQLFERYGLQVQPFASQARFQTHAWKSESGQGYRHLDSWLMDPDICREVFFYGSRDADLAVVQGAYDLSRSHGNGGSLDRLCQWLDLPRIAILDVSRIAPCQLKCPPDLDGLFLDQVEDRAEACYWRTVLESQWNLPVLGSLPKAAALRTIVDGLPEGVGPSTQLREALGDALADSIRLDAILQMAEERSYPSFDPRVYVGPTAGQLHVAVAYDDVFRCYFPDTLDALEAKGAKISVFSPLRDDALPTNTDVVYLGCGNLDPYADTLSTNHCMHLALARYAAGGGRIYAECSGLAYLCREISLADGRLLPMAGILPAVARQHLTGHDCDAAESIIPEENWLFGEQQVIRGYRNDRWSIMSLGADECCTSLVPTADIVSYQNVVGSRLHLDFAASPELLRRFFHPRVAAVNLA